MGRGPGEREWRWDRDSNPGDGFPPTHFPGVRLRPLGHPTVPRAMPKPRPPRKPASGEMDGDPPVLATLLLDLPDPDAPDFRGPGDMRSAAWLNVDLADPHQPHPPLPARGHDARVFTKPSSNSSSATHSSDTGKSRAIRSFSAASVASLSSGSGMAKSSRDFSAPIEPPVTGSGMTTDNRCNAVCIRMCAQRRCQSSTCRTVAPSSRGAPSTVSATSDPSFAACMTRAEQPSQCSVPLSAGCPPPSG